MTAEVEPNAVPKLMSTFAAAWRFDCWTLKNQQRAAWTAWSLRDLQVLQILTVSAFAREPCAATRASASQVALAVLRALADVDEGLQNSAVCFASDCRQKLPLDCLLTACSELDVPFCVCALLLLQLAETSSPLTRSPQIG